MMWWGDGWGVGAWIAMSLMMIAFWGGLAAVIVVLVRGFRSGGSDRAGETTRRPDEVLAERFARGEIDEEEYARRRELIQRG